MFTRVLLLVLIGIGTETVSMASISLPNIFKPQDYVNVTLNEPTQCSEFQRIYTQISILRTFFFFVPVIRSKSKVK